MRFCCSAYQARPFYADTSLCFRRSAAGIGAVNGGCRYQPVRIFYLSDNAAFCFYPLSMGISLLALSSSFFLWTIRQKNTALPIYTDLLDRPVDVLGELLYLAHCEELHRIDIHYDLPASLNSSAVTLTAKTSEHILSKTPTHKPAQKDLIEIDMALRQEFSLRRIYIEPFFHFFGIVLPAM
ncbi:MAG: hypothetical protein H7A34_03270 [bacterium]|nr:hypothetical protein [bacterium]